MLQVARLALDDEFTFSCFSGLDGPANPGTLGIEIQSQQAWLGSHRLRLIRAFRHSASFGNASLRRMGGRGRRLRRTVVGLPDGGTRRADRLPAANVAGRFALFAPSRRLPAVVAGRVRDADSGPPRCRGGLILTTCPAVEPRLMPSLDQFRAGQRVRIVAVGGTDALVQRLMEMGLLEGEEVEIIGFAPMGDPIEIRLADYRLSLRRSEAARI